MFFQLLYIHLFRPFLKYNPNNSPLPATVSPRKLCTSAAQSISKLLRLYKRSHGLRQICNIVVYIAHSAATIHLLNLPEKNAKRDITHGVKHLEEIAEGWLCARRTLGILSVLAERWNVELPEEAATVLARTDAKFGRYDENASAKAAAAAAAPEPDQVAQRADTTSSPAFPSYSMPLSATSTTSFFDTQGLSLNSVSGGVGAPPPHRGSEARSLPPNDSTAMTYARAQRDPATPASTVGGTNTNTGHTSGDSPSQLFGGVEQLIREGQDWWLRDQNQIAAGFENWGLSPDNVPVAWFNGPGATQGVMSSPAMGPTASAAGAYAVSPVVQGVDVSGGAAGMQNGVNGMNGLAGYGGALNSYDETEWYLT